MAESSDGAFTVDVESLDQLVSGITDFDKRVEDWCAEVDRRIADLHMHWDGDAAAAQHANHEKWMHGVAEMRDALTQLRTAAHQAHGNYGAAITAAKGMWP